MSVGLMDFSMNPGEVEERANMSVKMDVRLPKDLAVGAASAFAMRVLWGADCVVMVADRRRLVSDGLNPLDVMSTPSGKRRAICRNQPWFDAVC